MSEPPPFRWRVDLIGLFCLALFLRGAMLWTAIGQLGLDSFLTATPDTTNYLAAAHALIDHSGSAEGILFTFGPGFPFLLSLVLRLFGNSALPILALQLVLSSLSCLLIYRLGRQIIGDYLISMVAGIIAALSLTSISLSCLILSDTAYFFIFLLSIVLFVDGIRKGRWWRFLLSGILLGTAILTRSIGQFWPLVLIVIAIILWRESKPSFGMAPLRPNRRVLQVVVCLAISVSMMVGWMFRNHQVNGVFTLAFTSAGGPANVAAVTLERQTGKPYRDIETGWYEDRARLQNRQSFSLAEDYRLLQSKTAEVVRTSLPQMISVYKDMTWENLKERDYLHEDLLPKLTLPTRSFIQYVNRGHILFRVALIGIAALLWRRRFDTALLLALGLLYYASIIGFTKWQGSRLFHPGLIFESLLAAVALVTAVQITLTIAKSINARWHVGSRLGEWFDTFPASNRRYAALTAATMFIALVVLFRDFIFSHQMLRSVDVLGLGLPHHRFLLEHVLRNHSLPGWNPYPMGGVPFIEAISGAVFYPLALIDYLGYIPRMIGFNFLFHFLLGGLFTYLAARQLKLSPPASLVAGVAYAFSPLVLSWVAPGHDGKIFCATLFPLLVLFADRLLSDGRIRDTILLGCVFALMVVTPHLQMVVYAGIFTLGFAIFRLLTVAVTTRSPSGVGRRILLLTGALVIGLSLSAVQWFPSLRYIPNESPRSYEQTGVDYATTYSFHPEEVIALAIPEFCGLDEIDGPKTYWGRNSFKDNSESFGPIICFLAFAGLVLPGCRRKFWWLTVFGVILVYALGTATPLFSPLVKSVPLLGKFRAPTTAMFIALFATATMAGIGVDNIHAALNQDPSIRKRIFTSLLFAAAALFVVAVLMMLKGRGFLMYYGDLIYSTLHEQTTRGVYVQDHMMANLPFLQAGLWRIWACLIGLIGIVWLYVRFRRPFVTAVGIAVLLFVSTGYFASRCIKLIDPAVYYEPKPVTMFLQQRAGIDRAVGFALNQSSFLIGAYPIQSSIGYHSRPLSWYYRLSGEETARNFMQARFANLVGTRYVVYPNSPQCILSLDTLGPIPLDTAAKFEDCLVFENPNAFPRAFLVDSFSVLDSLWPVMAETVNGHTDLRKVALLEQPPALDIRPRGDTAAYAKIDFYDDDTISVSVSCQSNQLLVLTDSWYSAWHAYVDGKPTEILRVDGAFRAVPVPAGSRKVEFVFHSKYVTAGAITSGLTLALLLLTGLWAIVRRRLLKAKGRPNS